MELAYRFPEDIEGYCAGKDAFVKQLEKDALLWYQAVLQGKIQYFSILYVKYSEKKSMCSIQVYYRPYYHMNENGYYINHATDRK